MNQFFLLCFLKDQFEEQFPQRRPVPVCLQHLSVLCCYCTGEAMVEQTATDALDGHFQVSANTEALREVLFSIVYTELITGFKTNKNMPHFLFSFDEML